MNKKFLKIFLAAVMSVSAAFTNVASLQAAVIENADSTVYVDELPGFNATSYDVLKTGYRVYKYNDTNNHVVSSVNAKEFTMEADIYIESGNSASFMFGAEGKTIDTLGKLFGLEFSKNGGNITIKMFQDGAGALGDGVIPAGTVVTSISDPNAPIHAKVSYTNANGLEIWANGVKANPSINPNFEGAYHGGYIGVMTWKTTARYENLKLSVPVDAYKDGLPGMVGRSIEKLSSGYRINNNGGNNHAVSSLNLTEFKVETDVKYTSGDRFSLLFGSTTSNYAQVDSGNSFFGLEFRKSGDKIISKLFHEHGSVGDPFQNLTVASSVDFANPVSIDVAYTKTDGLIATVNGIKTVLPINDAFKNYYNANGGYIGFLTWDSSVDIENIVLSPYEYVTYTNELPDLKSRGTVDTLVDGYKMKDNNNNNYGTSNVTSKEFVYETTIQYNGNANCATVVFGAQSNTYSKLGSEAAFFGFEFSKDGSGNIFTKLFQDAPGVNNNEFISRGAAVGTAVDNKIKVKISYTEDNGLEYWVNDVKQNPTIRPDFETAYVGGYFGFLTWDTEAIFSDVKLTTYPETAYFNTNLTNLHGLNGTWKITSDGFYSSGGGDNFALSDTSAENFIYEADVTFGDTKGAASLVFRSGNTPGSASYVANIIKNEGLARIFKFPGGANVGSASIDTSKNTYHLRVEAIGTSLKFYIDDALLVAGNDATYTGGKLGLLTFNSTVTYQNVMYKEITASELPSLTNLTVTGDGVTFTPSFDADVASYSAYLPAGVAKMNVTATAAEGTTLTYSIVSGGGVEYDSGTLTSGTAKEVTPAYGTSKMIINYAKGDISSSVVINITKKSDASDMAEEEYRPQLHFSPEVNFMNDPNGLVYDPSNETWHLFFQYSPQLPNMGSQTWGHAVSDDLVNWVELPVAIEMDRFGAVFSGSAVVDENNTSGFFTDNVAGESKLVAVYTSAGSYGMVQNMAYSKDHGVTWTKYDPGTGDAMIPDTFHDGFRDPKVFKIAGDEKDLWYMVVAGGRGRIFTSPDLKNWTLQQELRYANGNELHSECPDLYPLAVLDKDGNATGKTKWVYNAASEFYVIGDMVKEDDGIYRFHAETNGISAQTSGNSSAYAGQSYYNDPVSGRRLSVHWMQDYSAPGSIPTKRWNGVQSFALETTLKQLDDGSYLVVQNPAEEIKALRAGTIHETIDRVVMDGEENILAGVTGQVYEVEAIIDMNETTATEFGFELRTGSGEKTVVKYNVSSKQMVLDKSSSSNTGYENQVLSYSLVPTKDGKIKLRAIVDNSIIETFGNDGDAHLIDLMFASPTSVGMAFYTKGGDVAIDTLKVYDMKSIYTQKSIAENTTMTQVSLTADKYVDTNVEFDVVAAVYPMNENVEIEWTYDDKLTLVSEFDKTATFIANEAGTYTITATINGVEKSVTVNAITRVFNTNLIDWKAVSGAWDITDRGVLGANKGSGDSFYVSDNYLAADVAFEFVADMKIEDGRAAGILFGVKDPTNPASHWYCLNSDLEEDGGHFKFFKNTGSQNWAVTAAYGTLTNKEYRLKVAYDGEGNFTISVAPYGSNEFAVVATKYDPDYEGGYFGVMTYISNTSFNNVYLYSEGTYTSIDEVEPIEIYTGTSFEDFKALVPTKVYANKTDGNKYLVNIIAADYLGVNLDEPGIYYVKAKAAGIDFEIKVIVMEELNYDELYEVLEGLEELDPEDYTDESVQDVMDVLDEIGELLEDLTASQEELDALVDKLIDAIEALEEKASDSPVVDPENPEDKDEPGTGDTTNVAGLMAMLLASAYVLLKRRKA